MAITDDIKEDISYTEDILKTWAAETFTDITVEKFTSGESFLFKFSEQKDFDILLLDIEMQGIDGVNLAKEIRKHNGYAEIIFITGYSDYISEGYEVNALHYLLKPVNPNKLFEVLTKAKERLKKNEKRLSVTENGEMYLIPLYEIKYIEVIKNYVTIHAKRDFTVKKTLSEFENELDERFYRMGRSFIINLKEIEKVTKTEVFLSNGTSLPLPRGQYDNINRAIIMRG
ncbi:MAG: response regulator transcription factor [Ruminococcaceae bacterium]|nr:response regulator transcription factor [Oscillospiraceae bacterium]